MAKRQKVLQFHIALDGIEPAVWRRIQLPDDSTFWDLHCAIQDAFGWQDCHLHEFLLGQEPDLRVGILNDEDLIDEDDDECLPGWEISVQENLELGEAFLYVYDFGDDWVHHVKLEKVCEAAPGKKYPICLEGERACPPEDSGGAPGYAEFLKAIRNPKHPEHKNMLEWIGKSFDPESFDPEEVRFSDPTERLAVVGLG
ncbi:MAG TPA: plasmid pRiA4b ORF-3 family protein [Thermoanaerobaculia bacterium]|nr:plasmid pRiA4b ORF-3 family protein [Thermoanaerobaculia bacterium]